MSIRLSATKLKTYDNCPLQYKYLYELWLIQLDNDALLLGSAYHNLLERYHGWQEILIPEWKFSEQLEWLIKKYKESPVNGEIITREERFKIEWLTIDKEDWNSEDVIIDGVFDRRDVDKTVEYKTSSFDYKDVDIDNFQTKLYIWWRDKLYWELLPIVYHINNKKKTTSKKYKPQIIEVKPDRFPPEETEKEILDVASKISKKEFPHKPWGHCFYCPFWPKWTWNCNKYYDWQK